MPRAPKNKVTTVAPVKNIYPCDLCGMVFARKHDLSRHSRSHGTSEDRLFSCHWENCTFKANQQGGLDTHINTHTGAKPFKCNFCVDAFGDRGSRSRHMRKKHADEYTPAPRRPRTIAKKMVEAPLRFKPYTYTSPTHSNTSPLSLGHHPELDLIGGDFTSSQLSEHYEQVYSTIVADRVTYTSQVLGFGLPDFLVGQASGAFPPSSTVLKNTTPPVLPARGLSRSVSFERLPTRVEESERYEGSALPYNPFNQ